MKAFEDFWKNYQYKPHFSPKSVAEDVWKAALEWFKRNCHEATDAEGIPTGYLLIKSHVLEEELNES